MEILITISRPVNVIPDEEGFKGVELPPEEIRDLLMLLSGRFIAWSSRIFLKAKFRDDELEIFAIKNNRPRTTNNSQ